MPWHAKHGSNNNLFLSHQGNQRRPVPFSFSFLSHNRHTVAARAAAQTPRVSFRCFDSLEAEPRQRRRPCTRHARRVPSPFLSVHRSLSLSLFVSRNSRADRCASKTKLDQTAAAEAAIARRSGGKREKEGLWRPLQHFSLAQHVSHAGTAAAVHVQV